jgi:hypothetical protein
MWSRASLPQSAHSLEEVPLGFVIVTAYGVRSDFRKSLEFMDAV